MNRFWIILFSILLISCANKTKHENKKHQDTKPVANTTINFTEEIHNFGSLKSGEIVVYTFEFTNTGQHDYYIRKTECDCGCISTNFAKDAVKPGEKGRIEVEFDSSGMIGREFKTIDIYGNSAELKHLAIFAEVKNELLNIE